APRRGAGKKPVASRAPITETFNGSYVPPSEAQPQGECGILHGPYTVPGPTYNQIVVSANDAVATNDIFVNLYFDDANDPDGPVFVLYTDVGFGEVVQYGPTGGLGVGDYYVEICPLASSINPVFIPPNEYTGTFTFDDSDVPATFNNARWKYFQANPPIDLTSADTREIGCWLDETGSTDCDFSLGNTAARAPWDWSHESNSPTNTTSGNGAITGEAWLSPLTPAEQYRPVSSTRNYNYGWTNAWYNTGCSPTNLVAGTGNDIDAAIVNMFVAHNRMHDWSYYLGFTEVNSNAQVQNFGITSTDRQNDPEIGNVQAGAVNGGHPTYLGRDNANQITLQDGVAPITNQYLWETIAGVIYVPCADGNYDMGIVGHEYGHMIQNRMTGGPSGDLGSSAGQGRRMGESWGDLTGMEIQNELGVVPTSTESPYAIGAFVLGSPDRGIRNYNMSTSPLNYSNMQYDPFGNASPHADGEIWSAINFDLRQAIYEAHLGDADPNLNTVQRQRECAEGMWQPSECAGNRRWVQIMHDGFLLQGASPSMLDARDAQLASDVMRFAADPDFGNHQDLMWSVYAKRGMGDNAISLSVTDLNPTPGFALPAGHSVANANVEFVAEAIDESNAVISGAQVFIGHFQARANPVALTGAGPVPIAPGSYEILVRADGYGHSRLELTLTEGQTGTVSIGLPTNFASISSGASASGDGSDHAQLIDDTEATTWDFVGQVGLDDKIVNVDLGAERTINRVQVSALPENGGNRFRALRQFAVDTCVVEILNDCTVYQEIFVSSPDAFNGQPIRPLSPDLIMQSFDIPETTTSKLRFRAIHNQCTGNPVFHSEGWAPAGVAPTTDCRIGVDLVTTGGPAQTQRDDELHAAEFQVFGSVANIAGANDIDGDGIADDVDNCVLTPNADQADADTDGVGDVCDNCLLVANADQCNTNAGTGAGQDQIGNICDADLNNDNIVNSFDLSILRQNFGQSGPSDSDLNCDNIVNSFDLSLLRQSFGQAPGPSGIAP
ncbi:MAG: hypothetical protein HKN85_01020, partial [Gammaproteobacteria bacterium]|nr:hypothetical protein [Gammaproteobacteria bacterium]